MNSLGIKVALVDDSPVIRSSIQEILSMWGYTIVLKAIHGKDLFRQLCTTNAPDICITDLNMPVMNGYETIKELRKKWPGIKVIAFSITNSKKEEEKALEAGAHVFVSKLSSITELHQVLQSMHQHADSGC
jgi:DNA-binding NarL/FixJ family response regulator